MPRALTTEEFIVKAESHPKNKDKDGNPLYLYLPSPQENYGGFEYINNRTKIQVYCKTCMKVFTVRPNDMLKGSGCGTCGYRKRKPGKRTKKWTIETIPLEAEKYETRIDFQRGSAGAYKAALKFGKEFLDEICDHMEFLPKGRKHQKRSIWYS